VAGQDTEQGDDGIFRIVRKVAKDRVISTVDPEARHGHKSRNRHFDGDKAYLSIDPDSELIDEVTATPANTPDREAVSDRLAPLADEEDKPEVLGDYGSPWLPWRLRTLDSWFASGVVLCSVGPLELVGSGLRESPRSGFHHHGNDDTVTALR